MEAERLTVQDFIRDARLIGETVTRLLTQMNGTLATQQAGVLALAGCEGHTLAPAPRLEALSSAVENAVGAVSAAHGKAGAEGPESALGAAQRVSHEVVASSPSVALANLCQVASQAMGLAVLNTVQAQQQLTILAQAVVGQRAAIALAENSESKRGNKQNISGLAKS